MNYFFQNSVILSKRIILTIKRDLLKSPIVNHFADNYPTSVLISYITKPFRKGMNHSHTNFVEVLELANIFRSLGFNVDIVDYDYEGFLNYDKYTLIFGFGEPLLKSFNFDSKKKRIYYGTGMHVSIQNHNSLKRIEEVKIKKGVWIPESGRVVEKCWTHNTTLVDAMILLGNEEVKKSYEKWYHRNIFLISPPFYKIHDYNIIIENKNFIEAKKNYLWFGSTGLIHKGLDLLLDIFKTLPNLHLHVCGPIENEPRFEEAYHTELYETSNIHTHGFVNIDSSLFKEILNKCAFIIYPSCAEGGGAAVLNVCGNGGLIPVLTKEVSIDVDDFGLVIDSLDHASIRKSIDDSQKLSKDEIKTLSYISGTKMSKHTIENYNNQMSSYLRLILSESK